MNSLPDNGVIRRHDWSRVREFMVGFWGDILYGLRLLEKNLGFAATAILTMAIGIGSNTAIFSIIDGAVFFRPPYPSSSRIVSAGIHDAIGFGQWEKLNNSFTAMSADSEIEMTMTRAGEPTRLQVARVSSGFFSVLEVEPMLGRTFLPSETQFAVPNIAILSYELWRSRFGANPNEISETIRLNDRLYTVIGVMPEQFVFPSGEGINPSILIPLSTSGTLVRRGSGGHAVLLPPDIVHVLGRLKPKTTIAEAQANIRLIAAGPGNGSSYDAPSMLTLLSAMWPGARFSFEPTTLIPLQDYLVGRRQRRELLVLWGAVGFLLLIACVNVTNLMLARALAREKEIAVRVALGAQRGRVARQLLTESMLLATFGGVVGIGVAYWVVVLVRHFGPTDIPRLAQAAFNLPVLSFTAAIAALAGIVGAVSPARSAWRVSTVEALKEGAHASAGRGHRRLRDALAVAEIAMGLILAIGAGLLTRSFLRLTDVPLHFDPRNILTVQIELSHKKYPSLEQQTEIEKTILANAKRLPMVVSAAATDLIPGEPPLNFSTLQIEGRPMPSGMRLLSAGFVTVSPNLFQTARIPILKGREFQSTDTATSPQVAVVNEAFVRRFLPDVDPLGQRISQNQIFRIGMKRWITVVGVVANPKANYDEPVVYRPCTQELMPYFTLLIRTRRNPLSIVPALRSELDVLDRDLPVFNVATMDQVLGSQVATQRFETVLLGTFALIALALAALGVYGVISYEVGERTSEIGIRMALGAEIGTVLRMILYKTLYISIAGITIGVGGALAVTRYMESLLYEVHPYDPWTFAIAASVLLVAAVLAGFLPARRAAGVDPLTVLRCE